LDQTADIAKLTRQTANGRGDVKNIVYTKTRRIEAPRERLRERRVYFDGEHNEISDAFKMLRTQILIKLRDRGGNALTITSPGEGEGKTVTAINLAVNFAIEVDHTVLLVDANLRHPNVHEFFGVKPTPGLSEYLLGECPLEDMLIHSGIGNFVFLPGGRPLANSSELLGSNLMENLVLELKTRYPQRIVLFDLPPVLSTSDALAFSSFADAALLVAEAGRTSYESITRAAELIGPEKLIGVALNKGFEPSREAAQRAGWLHRLGGAFKSLGAR